MRTLKSNRAACKFSLYFLLVVCTWENYLTSLRVSILGIATFWFCYRDVMGRFIRASKIGA